MSPMHQSRSVAPAFCKASSTVSKAARLEWMSETIPMRTQGASLIQNTVTISQSVPSHNRTRRLGLGAALLVAGGALGLYIRTCAPDVLVGDSGEFQFTGAILGIPHPTGYPLYTLLGWLWSMVPLRDVAYRINLSSAVYMAGAVALTAFLAWRLLDLLRPPPDPDAP